MRWFSPEQHGRMVAWGERTGLCPGCRREVETFGSVILPDETLIGIACKECLDDEAIASVDPRDMGPAIRQSLIIAEARKKLLEQEP